MPKARINGLDFYYDFEGSGEPLLLISGVSSDHTGWKLSQVPALVAAGYKCILFDNRDVGQTGMSPAGYSTAQFAEDTASLLRHLEIGPVHVLGASMGGMIAQELAILHPECIRSLTLVCTTARPDACMRHAIDCWKVFSTVCEREDFFRMRVPWLFTHRWFENPEAMQMYMQRVLSNPYPQPPAAFQRQCDAINAHDALDRLQGIRFPTHVIVGAEDILIPPRHSELLASRIPGAKLTVIPETGHCLFWETTNRFNAAVLEFLAP